MNLPITVTQSDLLERKNKYRLRNKKGDIFVNSNVELAANEWSYVLAHNLLHLAFGHFDREKMPEGAEDHPIKLNDEVKIYAYLLETEGSEPAQVYGLNASDTCDMIGIEAPLQYKTGECNPYVETFSAAITHSIKQSVYDAGRYNQSEQKETTITQAAAWFLSHYPLLGGLAFSFKIIEDVELCHRYEIHIAAVDADHGEI